MINFIPIDRSTFRKNPNAGQTESVIPGLTNCVVNERLGNGAILRWQSDGEFSLSRGPSAMTVEGAFICFAIVGAPLNKLPVLGERQHKMFSTANKGIEIKPREEYERIQHAPAPLWLFDYKDVAVICPNGHKHKFSELKDVENEDGYAADICPACSERVELEYESPEKVAVEMGMKS